MQTVIITSYCTYFFRQISYDLTHVESNEQTELTRKMGTDSQMENMTASGLGRGQVVDGLSKKERELKDMDNSVAIAGEGWV